MTHQQAGIKRVQQRPASHHHAQKPRQYDNVLDRRLPGAVA